MLYPRAGLPEVPRFSIDANDVDTEVRRLDSALDGARRDLGRVRLRVQADVGAKEAEIFAVHEAMLGDREFMDRIGERVRRDHVNAEQAVEAEVADVAKRIASITDPYLRERAIDVRDVGQRLLASLRPQPSGSVLPLPPGSVIVAVELLPSETVDLDRAHVAAIVTEVGGETSHVAILARALGIPAVTAIQAATRIVAPGTRLFVDGDLGEVTLEPSGPRREAFSIRRKAWAQFSGAADAAAAEQPITLDGERITLLANLGRADEAGDVRRHRLEGVGLFRTEFLFLDSHEPPGYDHQLEIYRKVGDALAGLPLTVRTLDLGGDKIPSFLVAHLERNPSLGLRGLRFSLQEGQLFDTQLLAICQASTSVPLRILFPMVLGVSDLGEARERLRRALAATKGARPIQVGAMIETPAAVFAIDEILEQVDFLSLGTNDLTQFMLAADRDAAGLLDAYSVLHPSVLRALARVLEAAKAHGKRVSVCGEAAGDPATATLLVGLGVRELSMSPRRAGRVRYALRRVGRREVEQLSRDLLATSGIAEARDRLEAFARDRFPLPGTAAR